MKKKSVSRSAFFKLPVLLGVMALSIVAFLTVFATANPRTLSRESSMSGGNQASLASPGGGVQESWTARYNGTGNGDDAPITVAVDDSGNVYVTGSSLSTILPDYDYATIKYNSADNNNGLVITVEREMTQPQPLLWISQAMSM